MFYLLEQNICWLNWFLGYIKIEIQMNKLISHWLLYFFWIKKYFESKNVRGASEMAQNMVLVSTLLYIVIYILSPLVVLSFGGSSILKDYKLIVILFFCFILYPMILAFTNRKNIKERLREWDGLQNWKESYLYKKGRFWARFHFIFILISIPLVTLIIGFLLRPNN